jgi:hypothetical protein
MINLGEYGLVGPAAVAILAAEQSGLTNADQPTAAVELAKAIGPKRLNATPSEILTEFSSPRPGDLIPYYQLFWQIGRKGKLNELTARADVALRSPEYTRWPFRARALPAMARIHALGISLPSAQLEHEEAIISIHRSALDISQRSDVDPYIRPDREVLDAIWRTMAAALARNRNTWTSFAVGPGLIEEAVLLSKKFLDGEVVLFGPAVVCWQFLFSYEIATRSRTADHATVTGALARIEDLARRRKNTWFSAMRDLYKPLDGLKEILPQQSEIFMGLRSSAFKNKQAEDYFVLAQMERFFINSKSAQGTLKSPYLQISYVDEVEKAALPVLTAYGVNQEVWQRLRQPTFGGLSLSEGALEYFDEKFSSPELVFPTVEEREHEELHAAELSKWIPFRNLDEERFSHRFWRSMEGAFAALGARPLEDVLDELFTKEGVAFSKYLKLNISPKDILRKVHELVPLKKMQECFEATREYIDEGRPFLRTMQGWDWKLVKKPSVAPVSSNTRGVNSSSSFQQLETDQQGARQHSLYERSTLPSQGERAMHQDYPVNAEKILEDTANSATDVWATGEKLFAAIKVDVEHEHWGSYIIFNVDNGRHIVAPTLSSARKLFVAEFGQARGWCTRVGVPILAH